MDENTKQVETVDTSKTPTVSTEKRSIEPVTNGMNSLNILDPIIAKRFEGLVDKLIRSEKSGIKSVGDAYAILIRAQSLNIPFGNAIEHIHVINGKTGVDIHVIKALLLKAGVTWRTIKDYAPLYEYTDGINVYLDNDFPEYVVRCKSAKDAEEKRKDNQNDDLIYAYPVTWYSDFNNNRYKNYNLNSAFAIATNSAQAATIAKNGKIPIYRIPNQPVDYVTEYEFTRVVNNREITCKSKFSYSEAVAAGFFEKDTYKKYPKIMISHRAFVFGARDIASDAIMGCMETTELKMTSGKDLTDKDFIYVEAEAVEDTNI